MLKNKADCAFSILERDTDITVPQYISQTFTILSRKTQRDKLETAARIYTSSDKNKSEILFGYK